MRLILLGPPGAGKGTQCKRIIEKYDAAHLSSGDILRSERSAGTELGKEAQGYMDSGQLVPDGLIIDMMMKAVKQAGGNYVLDGFPRTVVQAEELDKALDQASEKIDAVVNLEVEDEVIASRLTGRRSCPKCGAVYHIENLPPENDNMCDKGCGELVQRDDDKPDVVSNRLKTYHNQTEPILDYYKKTGKNIVNVNADQDIDEVTNNLFAELGKIEG